MLLEMLQNLSTTSLFTLNEFYDWTICQFVNIACVVQHKKKCLFI